MLVIAYNSDAVGDDEKKILGRLFRGNSALTIRIVNRIILYKK